MKDNLKTACILLSGVWEHFHPAPQRSEQEEMDTLEQPGSGETQGSARANQ